MSRFFIGPIYHKNVMVMLVVGMMYQLCRQYGPGGENEWAALRGCQVNSDPSELRSLGFEMKETPFACLSKISFAQGFD